MSMRHRGRVPCRYHIRDADFYQGLRFLDPFLNVDREIIPILRLINSMSFFASTRSCCGHGRRPLFIKGAASDDDQMARFMGASWEHHGRAKAFGIQVSIYKDYQDDNRHGFYPPAPESHGLYAFWMVTVKDLQGNRATLCDRVFRYFEPIVAGFIPAAGKGISP